MGTVAMLGVCGSRSLRVHGLGCWEKLSVDVPVRGGDLIVFGGPLKERWLYRYFRQEGSRGEQVLLTLMLHADAEMTDLPSHGCNKVDTSMYGMSDTLLNEKARETPTSPSSASKTVPGGGSSGRWRRQ